jgi:outer membrane protein TolC
MEALIRSALDSNRDLRAARYDLETAREQVSEAWSNVYPSVDLNASFSRNISPNVQFLPAQIFDATAGPDDYISVQFGADNNWNSTISLEQPLFRASAFIGVGAAGRFESFQGELVRGQEQSVVTQVRTAYYQLLLAQEQVRLTENSLRRRPRSIAQGSRRTTTSCAWRWRSPTLSRTCAGPRTPCFRPGGSSRYRSTSTTRRPSACEAT